MRLEHHHLVPRALGGGDEPENLITLCAACHGRAHGVLRRSTRALTKRGLANAKARGKALGWANPSRSDQAEASAAGVAVQKAGADRHAANVLPVVREIERAGVTTLRGIAEALNARGVQTARGGRWYAATVRNLMMREGVAV